MFDKWSWVKVKKNNAAVNARLDCNSRMSIRGGCSWWHTQDGTKLACEMSNNPRSLIQPYVLESVVWAKKHEYKFKRIRSKDWHRKY